MRETDPRKLYEHETGERLDVESFSSVAKYCQWLELEYAHELAQKEVECADGE